MKYLDFGLISRTFFGQNCNFFPEFNNDFDEVQFEKKCCYFVVVSYHKYQKL